VLTFAQLEIRGQPSPPRQLQPSSQNPGSLSTFDYCSRISGPRYGV